MTDPAVTGETVRLEYGPDPLRLARVMADVPHACAVCGAAAVHRLIAGAHWWDREASARLREQARGLSCGRCGALAELPVPLLQYRDLDGADLVVGLPAGSAPDSDRAWIAEIIRCLRDRLPSAPAVVTVRVAWWTFIDAVPLGPALAGLTGPPEVGEPAGESDRWLAATRAALTLPDIPEAMSRFITAPSVAGARRAADAEPTLTDPRWRLTVELWPDSG